jgi:N-acetylglucosamine-6-phosphate deacetylase
MSGDMLATLMAWLEDVPAGGGTGYDFPTKEMLVEPERFASYVVKQGCQIFLGTTHQTEKIYEMTTKYTELTLKYAKLP